MVPRHESRAGNRENARRDNARSFARQDDAGAVGTSGGDGVISGVLEVITADLITPYYFGSAATWGHDGWAGPERAAEIKEGRAHRDFGNSLLLSSQFRLPTHKASETRPPQTSPPRQEMRWWCPRTLPHFRFRCQMMRRQPRSGSPEPRLQTMLTHSALRCAPRAHAPAGHRGPSAGGIRPLIATGR